jgi:hypothetical protein
MSGYKSVMLSVVIPTILSDEGLARTLASLVPAAAEGVVREVVVVDEGHSEGTALIADSAGCVLVTAGGGWAGQVRAGMGAVRRAPWVLILPATVILERDWFREVASFIERAERTGRGGEAAGVFRLELDAFGWKARVAERIIGFCSAALGMPAEEQGLLLQRRLWDRTATGGHPLKGHTDTIRRLGRGRIQRLRVTALAAAPEGHEAACATARGVTAHVMRAIGLAALAPQVSAS